MHDLRRVGESTVQDITLLLLQSESILLMSVAERGVPKRCVKLYVVISPFEVYCTFALMLSQVLMFLTTSIELSKHKHTG